MSSSSTKSKVPKLRDRYDAVSYFATHQRVKGYNMEVQRAHALSWNCDGTKIVCGSQDRRVSVGTVDSACRVRVDTVTASHDDSVDQVAFQHESPYVFASASTDKTVCVWDVRQRNKHTKLNTSAPNLYVTWSPCGRYLVYGDRDNRLHMVDGRTLAAVKTHDFKWEANEFVYHPSGKYLFVSTGGGKVEILSTPSFSPIRTIQAHSGQSTCLSVAISKDEKYMAVGGNDALCTIWTMEELICESTVDRLDYPVRSCSFSCDSRLLAICSEDHVIDIGWAATGQKVSDVRVDGEVFSVAWHPKQMILAYASVSSDSRDRDNIRLFGFTS